MADEFDNLRNLNATLEALLDADAPAQALDDCIVELAASVSQMQTLGVTDSKTTEFVLDALVSPFKEASAALTELLVPDGFSGDGDWSDQIQEMGKELVQSVANPWEGLLAAQLNVMWTGIRQASSVYFGDGAGNTGVLNEVQDRTVMILKELLLDPSQDGANMLGMVFYALDQTFPAIDNELVYIRRMRKALRGSMSEVSALPPSMIPGLPNAQASMLLCEAEGHLKNVQRGLRNNRIWRKPEYELATSKVCQARDTIASGSLSETFVKHLKNLYGLSDLQASALRKFKFLSSPSYRLRAVELVFWHNALQREDPAVRTLHANLTRLIDLLTSLSGLHIADVLEQIVEILRRQIRVVRAQLEANAAGTDALSGVDWKSLGVPVNPNDTSADASLGLTTAGTQVRDSAGSDVGSYIGVQSSVYVTLSALCYLMRRVERLQSALKRLLDINSRFMNMLLKFVARFSVDKCGQPDGAEVINTRVTAYLKAAETRLVGRTRNDREVQEKGKRLLAALDGHEKFLTCFRLSLVNGQGSILSAISNALAVYRAIKNLAALARQSARVAQALATLDIAAMYEGKSTNAVDTLLRALQCFVLQCDNAGLRDLAKSVMDYLALEKQQGKAKVIRISTLDGLPRAGKRTGINRRLAAFLRLMQALTRLTNPNLDELCSIPVARKLRVAAPATTPKVPVDTTGPADYTVPPPFAPSA